ncbi:MAG TPA: hypothetical protein DFS52_14880 [Myxococcales bacterium]|jgi:hypothetical protein|nr:hypothetical protein [Myxococcales bacterium]
MIRTSITVLSLSLLFGCATGGSYKVCNDRTNRCVEACPSAPRGPAPQTPLGVMNDPRALCEQDCAKENRACERSEAERKQREAESKALVPAGGE